MTCWNNFNRWNVYQSFGVTSTHSTECNWCFIVFFFSFQHSSNCSKKMRLGIHLILRAVGVWLIIIINSVQIESAGRELPCNFMDSINITDGTTQHNKSIIFNGITFSEHQYAYVHETKSNQTYPRGCLCDMKPCLRLCCPYGSIFERSANGMSSCRNHEAAAQFENEIYAEDPNAKNLLVNHHFGYVDDRPCKDLYSISEYKITKVNWIACISSNYNFFYTI